MAEAEANVAGAEADVAVCRAERVVVELHRYQADEAGRAEADHDDRVAAWRAADEATAAED